MEALARPALFVVCAAALLACDPTTTTGGRAVYPDAEAYSAAPVFEGSWRGRISDWEGELLVGELSARKYFGNFSSAVGNKEIAVLFEQSVAVNANGASLPSNRLVFTWQDGQGQRGKGWVKIDEAGRRLEGSAGFNESIEGQRWSFERSN